MRIHLVNRTTGERSEEYESISHAIRRLGTTRHYLKQNYIIERKYPEGYWVGVDDGWLKTWSRMKYGDRTGTVLQPNYEPCLIE